MYNMGMKYDNLGRFLKQKRNELGMSATIAGRFMVPHDKLVRNNRLYYIENRLQDLSVREFLLLAEGFGVEGPTLLREYLEGTE